MSGVSNTDWSDYLRIVSSAWPVTIERAREFEARWSDALNELRETEILAHKQGSWLYFGWLTTADSDYSHLYALHDQMAIDLVAYDTIDPDGGEYSRWPEMRTAIIQTVEAIGTVREKIDYSKASYVVGETVKENAEARSDATADVEREAEATVETVKKTVVDAADAVTKAASGAADAATKPLIGIGLALVAVGALYVFIYAKAT